VGAPWYFYDDGDLGLPPVQVPPETRDVIRKSHADDVYHQLTDDYPKASLEWVHHAAWESPRVIPFSELNMQSRGTWRAAHEPGRVKAFADHIRKRLRKGKSQLKKPAVVVYEPGKPHQGLIIDGHHRTLGAEQAGEEGVLAWPGHAHTVGGPWMELHDLQFDRASGSARTSINPESEDPGA
jgi:hypothetical protein